MDRQIVYPAQIPLDSDQLNAQRNAYVGLGHLAGLAYGDDTVAAGGLACTPGSGMTVAIAPGSLLAAGVVDASAYGTLAAVGSVLVRQYVSGDPLTLNVPGAGATYVVYVTPVTVDADDTVLPFYNAADPSVTYAGSGNSGQPAPTVRRDVAQIGIGTSVPSGAYPLWTITVPAGATAITAAMIAQADGAPFYQTIPELQSRFASYLPLQADGYSVTYGGFSLDFQTDGNLVIYRGSGASRQTVFSVGGADDIVACSVPAAFGESVTVGKAAAAQNPVPLSQLQGFQYVPSVPPAPTTQNRITNSFLNEDGSLTVVMTTVTGGINAAIPYSYEPSSVTVTTDSNGYPVYQWRVGPLLYQSFTAYASDTSVIVYPTAFSSVPNVFFAPPHIPSSGGNADASLIANETRGTKTATQVEIDVRYVSSGANGAYNTNQYINVLAVGLA